MIGLKVATESWIRRRSYRVSLWQYERTSQRPERFETKCDACCTEVTMKPNNLQELDHRANVQKSSQRIRIWILFAVLFNPTSRTFSNASQAVGEEQNHHFLIFKKFLMNWEKSVKLDLGVIIAAYRVMRKKPKLPL